MPRRRTRFGGDAPHDLTSLIFVGDLARAYARLEPDDNATAKAIAEALGFEWRVVEETHIRTEEPSEEEREAFLRERERRQRERATTEPAKPKVQPGGDWLSSVVEARGKDEVAVDVGVQPLSVELGDTELIPPPFEPLFFPSWTRAILSHALATKSGDGPVDMERLIELIVRREPIDALPRFATPTLRRGVQLLIDKSEAMQPFDRDQKSLTQAIQAVMGIDKVHVQRFATYPSRAVWETSKRNTKAYAPPSSGTLVLLLSDLGLTRPLMATDWATVDEWIEFAQTVRRAGCPLVACVPYAPWRWNPRLRGLVKMIPWDRGTTASIARTFARGEREAAR